MSRPIPARSLDEAWSGMTWEVEPGSFALLGFAEEPTAGDLEGFAQGPGQLVREAGETTLLVPESAVAGVLARHPDASLERDLAWIRFRTPMGWEVVGFLARVTGELAAAGVPLGAICGFSRDHLFLSKRYLPRASEVLEIQFGPPRS
jgi:hypothetical protein